MTQAIGSYKYYPAVVKIPPSSPLAVQIVSKISCYLSLTIKIQFLLATLCQQDAN
jgi:hypothetical protein